MPWSNTVMHKLRNVMHTFLIQPGSGDIQGACKTPMPRFNPRITDESALIEQTKAATSVLFLTCATMTDTD